MQLITFIAVITISAAAQLPTNNYLPPNQGGNHGHGNSGGSPSNNYLPPNQGGQGHGQGSNSGGRPSNNYLPPNQGQQGGHGQGSNHLGSGSNSYLPPNQGGQGHGGHNGQGSGTGNTRPQQEAEKNAVILQQDQEITEDGFHYSYETSNGIRAEEAGNTEQSQGGFSYKGDDGNTYTVTFTAGEGGFKPQGAHLPVPPPTPAEILLALQQNEKDEAAGIFDDGKYHADANGGGHGGANGGSSGQSGYGSGNHQGSVNSNSGYRY